MLITSKKLRADAEAEAPILWPPDEKKWLIRKGPDAGKDWRQEQKGMTEDEMVGCHHQLNIHEFGQTLGVGDGQGGLTCCGIACRSSCGCKKVDTTEWLNSTDMYIFKGLDLIDSMPEELWTKVYDTVQETVIKTIPKKKKCKKAKWLSKEALQISWKKKKNERQRRKGKKTNLNAEF